MQPIEIIYLLTSFTSLTSSIPQLKKLLEQKRADELSVTTWTMWFICQIVVLTYVTSRGEVLMSITSSAWLIFYGAMLGMIMYYRRYPRPFVLKEAIEPVEQA